MIGVSAGALVAVAVAFASPAVADDNWLPHSAGATWTYQWTDTAYAPTPTTEQVSVKSSTGTNFTLAWTTDNLNNPSGAVTSNGTVDFSETNSGIVNTNWSSTPPPQQFPILCAQQANCGNALSSVYYNIIWGSRNPVPDGPLVQGLSWSSTGGAANDVTSLSTYLGQEQVNVPAFPSPVTAAVVRTQITQAGALGDPYGSGKRTIWWVYGAGPVKIIFEHAGASGAPVTTAMLQSTDQTPLPPPTDVDYFPFTKHLKLTYSWTNSRYMTTPEVQRFTIDAVVNRTARYTVTRVSGPINVTGSYGFSKQLDGIINLWGSTSSATLLKFPRLGPIFAPRGQRNHFVTPFDLMNFGFNPVLAAYPAAGDAWASVKPSSDFTTYGITGKSIVIGIRSVTVPAGTFEAIVVRSILKQPGYPYGSGSRTCWFAANKGLVKLVFDHADGSVSTVALIK